MNGEFFLRIEENDPFIPSDPVMLHKGKLLSFDVYFEDQRSNERRKEIMVRTIRAKAKCQFLYRPRNIAEIVATN